MIKKILAAWAILMMLLEPVVEAESYQDNFTYQANVEGDGWMSPVKLGEVAGTTMQAKRLEALIINFNGGIKYSAHVQNIGWQNWVYAGGVAGTVGENRRMEAIKIQLVGNTEKYFDVYYRAHVQNVGWLGWAKNGEPAGTAGASLRMEAIQIQLVEKGSQFERGDKPPFAQAVPKVPTV